MVLETKVQSQFESYQRLKKMVLDDTLLSTQHYKVRIKSKVEQSCELLSPTLHPGVVAIEKGAFGSPSTKVANFNFFIVEHYTLKIDIIRCYLLPNSRELNM